MDLAIDIQGLDRARHEAVGDRLRAALGEAPAYLVGGAVRDTLLGLPLGDVDVAIEEEIDPVLDRIGVEAHSHERFGTATVVVDGRRVDIARTRRERYPRPGALPEVSPAPIRTDLARRDFTVNAMAVPLRGEVELLDPYGGAADASEGLLRVLHERSFGDDPTRALRAARYAARLGFRLEPGTEELLRAADLGTVSSDRVDADLFRIAAEREAVTGFRLLAEWGLIELDESRLQLLEAAAELTLIEPWASLVDRGETLLDVVTAPASRLQAARALVEAAGGSGPDSELFELAIGHDDRLLAIARALGAEWLDQHVTEWRRVRLRISGADLLAAGVPEGPAIGAGLRAALHARIDGRIDAGTEIELRTAMAAVEGGR